MAEQQEEEYHEFDDSDVDEEEEEGGEVIDISDIKSTPSKALRPSAFKDRVFILHAGDMTRIDNMKAVTLPHPTKGVDAKYIVYNKKLLEIQRMIDEPSSWFIDSNVEKDGMLYMATPIDPLFIAMPFLEKSRRKTADHQGYFSDNILTGDTWHAVLSSVTVDLTHVCESKTIGDDICVYRLSDDLTLIWLQKKLVRLMKQITGDTGVIATGTATVSTFVRTRAVRPPTLAETFNAAIGFLAEYVSSDWITNLKTAYEKQIPKEVPQPPSTLPSISNSSIFDDDFDEESSRDAKRIKKNPSTPTPKRPPIHMPKILFSLSLSQPLITPFPNERLERYLEENPPTSETGAKVTKLAAAAKGSAVISSFFQPKKK